MLVRRIGTRGHLFVFDLSEIGTDTANVYLIDGEKHWFLIDTFLGPEAMSAVKPYMQDDKPIIVVNTHSHFDHFWGNCAFPGSTIVGHALCRQGIDKQQQRDYLENHPELQRGKVELVAPNMTFEKRVVFEEDEVELFHSPGHTRDSISCIDRKDQVLLVGDNIGLPIPSIYPGVKVGEFIETLETYQALALPTIVSSHYNEVGDNLIAAHLEYLQRLSRNDTAAYDQGECKLFNDWNKSMLARQVE